MRHGFAFLTLIGMLLVLVMSPPIGAEDRYAAPDVPLELRVPPDQTLLIKAEAKGVQIYKSVEGKDGKLEWILEAPLAGLFSPEGRKLGTHYEGPSWEATDGSKVIRDKEQVVKMAAPPNPNGDIPWLLIKVKEEGGKEGVFNKVLYIQRIDTRGGKAPAEPPLRAGTKVGVEYKATYYLYGRQ